MAAEAGGIDRGPDRLKVAQVVLRGLASGQPDRRGGEAHSVRVGGEPGLDPRRKTGEGSLQSGVPADEGAGGQAGVARGEDRREQRVARREHPAREAQPVLVPQLERVGDGFGEFGHNHNDVGRGSGRRRA